jgi:CheY-specific phosphatase CheX
MQAIDIDPLIVQAIAEVLESMCFMGMVGNLDETVNPDCSWISAKLSFKGPFSGELGVRAPLATLQTLASNFLGEDEACIDSSQVTEFLGELSNMICGSILGRLGNEGVYDLSHPKNDLREAHLQAITTSQTLQLDEGTLHVWINLEDLA